MEPLSVSMRVIRTEIYFDRAGSLEPSTAVSFAWVGNPEASVSPQESEDWYRAVVAQRRELVVHPVSAERFGLTLVGLLAWAVGMPPSEYMGGFTGVNPAAVRDPRVSYILEQPIVVEQSPPQHIPLKELGNLLSKAPHAVGAFIGFLAADNSQLLFITVPAGMIIVSSAAGISRALEMGLHKLTLRVFHRWIAEHER